MNKNQDQELEQGKGKDSFCNPLHQEPMDPVSENISDARLSQIFGEALGDGPSKEETLAAWDAFEKKHISSEENLLRRIKRRFLKLES